MNLNSADLLVDYGDGIESEIKASGVTHVELANAHDQSCAVSKIEKSAREALVADATNEVTKVKELVSSQYGKLISREWMREDWYAAGGTTHIYPNGSAQSTSCGEYIDAVTRQLCNHQARDARNEPASDRTLCNTIPTGAVSHKS